MPLIVRLLLEENAGHPPMEWHLEAVSPEPSVDPGFLMEDPGMGHLLGTAWLRLNLLLGIRVTTVTVSR